MSTRPSSPTFDLAAYGEKQIVDNLPNSAAAYRINQNQYEAQFQPTGSMSSSLFSNNTSNFRPNFDILNAPKPQEYKASSAGSSRLAIDPNATGSQVSSYSNDGSVNFTNGRSTGSNSSSFSSLSSSNLGMSNDSLKNVFNDLGNIAETKANNDQRRFREDLPFQSRIYQDFDTEAAGRTEGIDTRAREQNSTLTKDRMRLQSTQNISEEKNREGKFRTKTKSYDNLQMRFIH